MLTRGDSFLPEDTELAFVSVVFSFIFFLTAVFSLPDIYQPLAVSYS